MRILYIQASWVPPPDNLQADRFVLLSEKLEGDVLQPVWFERLEQVVEEFGPGTYPEYTRGSFRYHWFLSFRYSRWRRNLAAQWFYLRKGLELHRRNRYDCIIVYSHMTPALTAVLLKLLTGARLIVEIATAPDLSYLHEHPRRTIKDRLMRLFSDCSLRFTVLLSDRVHLLYRTQLAHYPLLRRVPVSVFHEFVPMSLISLAEEEQERVVLLVGSPWYLKGADLLIEAFRRVADEFPDLTLRIQGYNADSSKLEAMTKGTPRIEIVKAVANPETLRRISRALVLVLPTRCDGMGRVLIEAMGARVPVIGSDAGGVPHYVHHGENGLVFPSGNVDELTGRLRELLGNEELRKRLGSKGYELAHTQYTERVYVDRFTDMVKSTILGEE
jgi:glycosyltransferase involved in cell wall biosynthesis